MKIFAVIILTVSFFLTSAFQLFAANFYVSPTGSNGAAGTSKTTAWQTIERVNQGPTGRPYRSGDSVLFKAGSSFTGSLMFTVNNLNASPATPFKIASYGTGRATIVSDVGWWGLLADNVAAMSIKNIRFRGLNAAGGGLGIALINNTPQTLTGIELSNVDISGYTYAMYIITGDIPAKLRGITLDRVTAHDNAAGPSFFGHYLIPGVASGDDYGIGDVSIVNSQFYRNTGAGLYNGFGAGLSMMNVENVVISGNSIRDNGGNAPEIVPNGPCAITIYDGHNVVIQNNDIYRQRFSPSNIADNGGIDFWGTDSFIQYNYIHDNEGLGLVLGGNDPSTGELGANWPGERNTIRYNILANNGRLLPGSTLGINYMASNIWISGVHLKDFELYNNTLFAHGVTDQIPLAYQLGMIGIQSGEIPSENIHIRNNILIGLDDVTLIEVSDPSFEQGLWFENNAYICNGNPNQIPVFWAWEPYQSVTDWSEVTGQERIDGSFAGVIADPTALVTPGTTGTAGYRLSAGSPLIDAGLNLLSTGLIGDVGTHDYFGLPIPNGNFDIGAHEF